MKRSAAGAIAAQGVQALASFLLQVLVARTLGISGLGIFSILYGVVVLCSGLVTGFVGDSLVVLDRARAPIRAALQGYTVLIPTVAATGAAITTAGLGLTQPAESIMFAVAILVFCLEEVVRRSLMAEARFWRVPLIDLVGLLATLIVVGIGAALRGPSLVLFLAALAVGQACAAGLGTALLERADRRLVAPRSGGWATVARYGGWRSLQQLLRPALLTGVRTAVTAAAGLTATGLLEAARTYTAPALLAINGISSFLFVAYARSTTGSVRERLRRADRTVVAMLAGIVVIAVVAVLLLPWLGPLLFGARPDLVAVIGWLAYTVSVAGVTPYGALAATRGRQSAVFAIRAGDTVFSLAAVLVAISLGAPPSVLPFVLTAGSALGGLAIRTVLLAPRAGDEG